MSVDSPETSETWFTSDWHLGHVNIINFCHRPFSSVEEMNETIIERHNSRVSPTDKVFVLGDVALGKIDESLALVLRMNGTKYLIPGNHDRCWSGHAKSRPIDTTRYTEVGFTVIGEDLTYRQPKDLIFGGGLRMCHFPYAGDSHDEDRYAEHRPVQKWGKEWLIHGHVHNAWKVKDQQINVGVDVWDFYPVPLSTIQAIIAGEDLAAA